MKVEAIEATFNKTIMIDNHKAAVEHQRCSIVEIKSVPMPSKNIFGDLAGKKENKICCKIRFKSLHTGNFLSFKWIEINDLTIE